ncbi:MAG: RIP metalloprotease RseP [Gemmatimonadota bacterium]
MILTLLATVLVLGVLILVHELGHFWAAKAVGIEVPRFSIGIGPKIVGFRRGETEYVLSWLPIGGYVKMAGQTEEEAMEVLEGGGMPEREPSPRDFDAKPLWARTLVISAGILMNLVFAFVAFSLLAREQVVVEPLIGDVAEGSPAMVAGLQPGDRILALDGDRVRGWRDVVSFVQTRAGKEIVLAVDRGGRRVTLRATPESAAEFSEVVRDSVRFGRLGITLDPKASERRAGPGEALVAGWAETGRWTGTILGFLRDLVTGRSSARELGGPIMIGQISGQAVRAGFWALLNFMAVISVNLAILNLLPIPVLDGGHLAFLGVEAVRGRALSARQRIRLTQVGLVVVVGLMLWAIGNDILRLLGI